MVQFSAQSQDANGKVIIDYKLDIDYESEGPDSSDEPLTQEVGKEDSKCKKASYPRD